MKKIGILTRRAGFNHGSSLQAYAMYKMLSSLGYDSQIINYDEYSGHLLWKVRPFIENIEWFIYKNCPFIKSSKRYHYLSVRSKQISRFNAYEKDFLYLTNKKCRNYQQLLEITKSFTDLVCGSDQIWSPLLYDPVFVFGFLKKESIVNTIAYAPSIGISNGMLIEDEEKEFIKKINFVSCREQKGAEILEGFLKKTIPVVLDPTLMVEKSEWITMASSVKVVEKRPYILCYFLGNNIPQKFIDNLKGKLDCQILNIQMFNRLNNVIADRDIVDLGPCHFLNLIAHAQWVCTDSYHATIFSFLFHRKMSVFERFKSRQKENQNSRIYTLLDSLNLQNVLKRDYDLPDVNTTIDYNKSKDLLNELQSKSLKFIKEALS